MARSIAAMPILKRTNRVVIVPKTAKVISTRNAATIMAAATATKTTKKPVVKPQAQVAPKARSNQKFAPIVTQKRHVISRKNVTVKYAGNNISDTDKEKTRRLRGIGKNRILIIVGNGPSILDVDLKRLNRHKKIDIMSINKPDPRIWPTTYWLFCDNTQYLRNEDLWKKYDGILINTTAIKTKKDKTHTIRNLGQIGFSLDLVNGFHIGRSSVYAAMQVGYWMDYSHIYIFGCDMTSKLVNGTELVHFYGTNPDVKPDNRKGRFANEAKHYSEAGRTLPAEIRKKYTFCSSLLKYDFVDKFNKLDHIIAIDHVITHANSLGD